MKSFLVDTGFLIAVIDSSNRYHIQCNGALGRLYGRLITSEPVITEATYRLRDYPKGVEALLKNLNEGTLTVEFSLEKSLQRISSIMRCYKNVPISLADASLICMAERWKSGAILTLNPNFLSYRWGKSKKFTPLVTNVFE